MEGFKFKTLNDFTSQASEGGSSVYSVDEKTGERKEF